MIKSLKSILATAGFLAALNMRDDLPKSKQPKPQPVERIKRLTKAEKKAAKRKRQKEYLK
jgi:hypothetical protein